MAMKFATIGLVLILLLGGVGAGIAYAAQDSLPNDALYPLKTGIEDLSVKLAGSEAAKFQLMLKHIDERVDEISALAAKGEPVDEPIMARLQTQLSTTLHLAAGMTNTDMEAALNRYRTSLMSQEQKMMDGAQNQAQNKNQGEADAAKEQVRTMLQMHRQSAEAGLQDPSTFRMQSQNGNLYGMPETFGPAGPPAELPAQGESPGFDPGPNAGQPETTPGNPGTGNGQQEPGEKNQPGESNQKGTGGNR